MTWPGGGATAGRAKVGSVMGSNLYRRNAYYFKRMSPPCPVIENQFPLTTVNICFINSCPCRASNGNFCFTLVSFLFKLVNFSFTLLKRIHSIKIL